MEIGPLRVENPKFSLPPLPFSFARLVLYTKAFPVLYPFIAYNKSN